MPADPNLTRTNWLRASPPMFERPWMDRFTRVHVAIVPLIFVPVVAICGYEGATHIALASLLGYVAVGYAAWTLTEYWLHRVVFHFEPERGIGARLHWMIHGVHHDHPNDPMRLVMPPSASIPLATVFVVVWQLVFGFGGGFAVSAGFLTGYLVYDLTHFYLHHVTPRGPIGRRLRELHMRHHFQDDTTGFGVSAPYWDRIFGTSSRRDAR